MSSRIAPSQGKTQELKAMLQGQSTAQSGEELLSTLVQLSTERVLQEALEHEQAEALGCGRYERRDEPRGYRNGYEPGRLKTAEAYCGCKGRSSGAGRSPIGPRCGGT